MYMDLYGINTCVVKKLSMLSLPVFWFSSDSILMLGHKYAVCQVLVFYPLSFVEDPLAFSRIFICYWPGRLGFFTSQPSHSYMLITLSYRFLCLSYFIVSEYSIIYCLSSCLPWYFAACFITMCIIEPFLQPHGHCLTKITIFPYSFRVGTR